MRSIVYLLILQGVFPQSPVVANTRLIQNFPCENLIFCMMAHMDALMHESRI